MNVLWLAALVASCTLFGVPKPENVSERLAIAYNVHTSVLQGTTSTLNSGDISSVDAEQVLKLADEARTLLDATRVAISGGDTATAEGKLNLGMSILSQLQIYLRAH